MERENNLPTDVFKAFNIARQTGDIEAIKSTLSEGTLQEIEKISIDEKKTFYEALNAVNYKIYGHHLSNPITRNQVFDGAIASIEARHPLTKEFDQFVFQKENDVWKLALDYQVEEIIQE